MPTRAFDHVSSVRDEAPVADGLLLPRDAERSEAQLVTRSRTTKFRTERRQRHPRAAQDEGPREPFWQSDHPDVGSAALQRDLKETRKDLKLLRDQLTNLRRDDGSCAAASARRATDAKRALPPPSPRWAGLA